MAIRPADEAREMKPTILMTCVGGQKSGFDPY